MKQFLDAFGLNIKEQRVYHAALELGEALQAPLAQKAHLKRTSLREMLPSLIARGVLEYSVRGKRKYIIAKDPRVLLEEIKAQATQAEVLLPSLLALQNTLEQKPVVRFYEDVEGVKQVYEQTLTVGQTIYSFVEIDAIHPSIQRWLINDYVPRRNRKKIKALNIVNASDSLQEIMPSDEFRENRTIAAKSFPFRMEILVFGDYVALIHFRKTNTPTATLIQSQAAATTFRSIHQLLWH